MIRSATSRRSTQSSEPIFEGQHSVTNNKLVIAQRADRHLLLSLYEQSKQIMQVRVDRCGKLPGSQPCNVPLETPALQTCIVFMTQAAQDYASDKVTLAQLKELKQSFEQQHPPPTAAPKRAPSTPASGEPASSKVVQQPASKQVLKKPAASTLRRMGAQDFELAGVSDRAAPEPALNTNERAAKRPRGPPSTIPDGTSDAIFDPSRQNMASYKIWD